ncbi:hypothetical protein LTR84_003572 [Exophiala bonariae]|uniref:Translation initiation factor IF-2, mitochondrial n=1 Tax=Exophiala bonariae TaxID=1690606 RepID=A0AAV9N8K1_9EURO|nr:hypothetical protein LTR84_003572 [Exophiala bonariae]
MRKALSQKLLLPRQDLCFLCAFRYALRPPPAHRTPVALRRAYQSSATSRHPGVAAALRVEDEDDTSSSHRGELLGWRCQCKHVNKPRRTDCTVCTTPRPQRPPLVYEADNPPPPLPPPVAPWPTPQSKPLPGLDGRSPPHSSLASIDQSPARSSPSVSENVLGILGSAPDRGNRPFAERFGNNQSGRRGRFQQSDAAWPESRFSRRPPVESRYRQQNSSESRDPVSRDLPFPVRRVTPQTEAHVNPGRYPPQRGSRDESFPLASERPPRFRELQNRPGRDPAFAGQSRVEGFSERTGISRPPISTQPLQQPELASKRSTNLQWTPMGGSAPRERELRDRAARDESRVNYPHSRNDDRVGQNDRYGFENRRTSQRGSGESWSTRARTGSRYEPRVLSTPGVEAVEEPDLSAEFDVNSVEVDSSDYDNLSQSARRRAMEKAANRRSRVYEIEEAEEPMPSFRNSSVRGPESRDRRSRISRTIDDDDDDDVYTPKALRVSKSSQKKSSWGNNHESEAFSQGGVQSRSRQRVSNKVKAQKGAASHSVVRPEVHLPEFISVEKLAQALKVRLDPFIAQLEEEGFEGARYDHILDASTSAMFADLYGFEPIIHTTEDGKDLVARPLPEDMSVLPPRPPIVTIMGHVDHGKTTILDYLRKSSVVDSEHGGITQHIGAFSVTMPGSERNITFLDTPGHAAFLDMRRRGANVTDIVVLVVAADDGVMPQTIEAINHAKEAGVQIIVAINKVDKEDADIERVKGDLSRHGIVVESYGGEYQSIPVSGKTGQGMADLEEAITLLADVNDFRAEIDGPVEGWIIESKVTAAGRVATVLVRRGTLRPGNFIVAGNTWARVRTLKNDSGQYIEEAPPGTPVQVDGWRGTDPDAGMEVLQADNEHHAKEVVDLRIEKTEAMQATTEVASLNLARTEEAEARAKVLEWEKEQGYHQLGYKARPQDNEGWVEKASAGPQRVHFVIKADVAGSTEALVHAVSAIGNSEIMANIVHSGVGELTESDIKMLAATGEGGYAISFNQSVDNSIRRLAEVAGLPILDHNIIYKVTDDVTEKLSAALPPIVSHRVLGEAEIGQLFDFTVKKRVIKIAGCKVTNGTISRAQAVRVLRHGEVIYTGMLESLKHIKKDVTEMRKGTECGMAFEHWEDFQEGDQVQCFEEIKEKRTL